MPRHKIMVICSFIKYRSSKSIENSLSIEIKSYKANIQITHIDCPKWFLRKGYIKLIILLTLKSIDTFTLNFIRDSLKL